MYIYICIYNYIYIYTDSYMCSKPLHVEDWNGITVEDWNGLHVYLGPKKTQPEKNKWIIMGLQHFFPMKWRSKPGVQLWGRPRPAASMSWKWAKASRCRPCFQRVNAKACGFRCSAPSWTIPKLQNKKRTVPNDVTEIKQLEIQSFEDGVQLMAALFYMIFWVVLWF